MIHLDTSALIDSLCGERPSWARMRSWVEAGTRLGISTLVLYEFRRGPRRAEDLGFQRICLPDCTAIPFEPEDAVLSAEFYRTLPRARAREIDFAIAACAIRRHAVLWTLNPEDFEDIPGLKLARP